jgi:hypothetical protein
MPIIPDDDAYSEAETIRRRETALMRMMNTPPKPHAKVRAKNKWKPSRAKGTSAKHGKHG